MCPLCSSAGHLVGLLVVLFYVDISDSPAARLADHLRHAVALAARRTARRVAIVFIIDPFYTLPLLMALIIGSVSGKVRSACRTGLVISCAYLMMAAGAKWSVEQRLTPALAEADLKAAPVLIQPTPFNIALWRATVIDEDRYYESLISVFDRDRVPALEPLRRNVELEASALEGPLGQRLTWFTGPFLRFETRYIHGQETLVATDIRLGFPGFHPFSFTLATREGDRWVPVAISEEVRSPRGVHLATLARLAARAGGDVSACAPATT